MGGGWSGTVLYTIVGNMMTIEGRAKCGYELNAQAGNPVIYFPAKPKQESYHDFAGAGSGRWRCRVSTSGGLRLTSNSEKQIWAANDVYIDISLALAMA